MKIPFFKDLTLRQWVIGWGFSRKKSDGTWDLSTGHNAVSKRQNSVSHCCSVISQKKGIPSHMSAKYSKKKLHISSIGKLVTDGCFSEWSVKELNLKTTQAWKTLIFYEVAIRKTGRNILFQKLSIGAKKPYMETTSVLPWPSLSGYNSTSNFYEIPYGNFPRNVVGQAWVSWNSICCSHILQNGINGFIPVLSTFFKESGKNGCIESYNWLKSVNEIVPIFAARFIGFG